MNISNNKANLEKYPLIWYKTELAVSLKKYI